MLDQVCHSDERSRIHGAGVESSAVTEQLAFVIIFSVVGLISLLVGLTFPGH
jgi:hypothetical protein